MGLECQSRSWLHVFSCLSPLLTIFMRRKGYCERAIRNVRHRISSLNRIQEALPIITDKELEWMQREEQLVKG
jgi:hypothetical protein